MGEVVSFRLGKDCQQILESIRGELTLGIAAKRLLDYVTRCPPDDLRRILGTLPPKNHADILEEYAKHG